MFAVKYPIYGPVLGTNFQIRNWGTFSFIFLDEIYSQYRKLII